MVGRLVNVGASAGDSGADNARRAFSKLDAVLMLSVESATTTAQPGAPTVDQAYIIPTGKTGTNWASFSVGQVAVYRGTSYTDLSASGYWEALTPNEGWRAWVRDTDREVLYNSGAWDATPEQQLLKQRAAGQFQSFRNALINGDFNIWQRATSFASIASGAYFADRWLYEKSGVMVHDVSRSTDVPTVAQAGRLFNYSALVDCTTIDAAIGATDICAIDQRIEGYEWVRLAQRACILSFWVKSPKAGIHCVSLRNAGQDRSFVAEYTVNVADTWEFKTVVVTASPSAGTWNYTTGIGVIVSFPLAVGSNYQGAAGSWQSSHLRATANQQNLCDNTANNFLITGVQLEACDTTEQDATPFESVPYEVALQRCLRYYQLAAGNGHAASTTVADMCLALAVEMRATPSLSVPAAVTIWDGTVGGITQSSPSASFITGSSTRGGVLRLPNFSGLTANRSYVQSSATPVAFSAEL